MQNRYFCFLRKILPAILLFTPLIPAVSATHASSSLAERDYILTTATTGGTYYPVGIALATLTKVKLEPKYKISLSAISSAGSGENLKLLRENEAQFAILQGLYGAWAWNGSGDLKTIGPQKHLRSITMLWQNVEHFAIKSDHVRSGTAADLKILKGKHFSIGRKNSGTEGSGRHILRRLGFQPDRDFVLVNLGYGESAESLQNGTIEGMNIPAGLPVGAIARAFAALGKDITIVNFTDEQLEKINRGYNLWSRYIIPANTYPGQDYEIKTISQPNFLAVRDDVDDDAVYRIVKIIYENLTFLSNIHPATMDMDIRKAVKGLPFPLHPGAARFYREQGITLPDRLITK
jgi:TRAP transporter TAXI family solute receptor